MEWKIFKAYDIRGIYPSEINEKMVYETAKGYVKVFNPKTIAVGMDARLSSPALKDSLLNGLLECGVDVIDIGGITTDMLYFTVGKYGYDGGIIVSASHNPGEYNGLKMVREKACAISSDTGLFEIRDMMKAGKHMSAPANQKGTVKNKEILDDYISHVLSFIDTSKIKPFKIVANANFGYVSKSLQPIFKTIPLQVMPLNFEPDGSFPKGPPDPLLPGNRTETSQLIQKESADFGVAWDADADRVMFFDEKGEFVSGAYIGALLASIMLDKNGADNKIIYDPRTTWPILKAVQAKGGTPILWKCGHTFIKDKMRSDNALFASEMSAHYYFRDNYYADNGLIPFLLILEHLSNTGLTFSQMMQPYLQDHCMLGETNFRVSDVPRVINQIKNRFKDGEINEIDGYSVETNNWRFNIRASNTEPLLRLNVEARTTEDILMIKKQIEDIISEQS